MRGSGEDDTTAILVKVPRARMRRSVGRIWGAAGEWSVICVFMLCSSRWW